MSADGLTYTYTIRDDAKWYTADGEECECNSEDFVTGLKHSTADVKSFLKLFILYRIQLKVCRIISMARQKDFSTVGVKAVDDHIQYTLNALNHIGILN